MVEVNNENHSLFQHQEIDKIADDFEAAFQDGRSPKIEAYLEEHTSVRGCLLKELIALEVQLRCDAGERVSVTDYRARFEGVDRVVDSAFRLIAGGRDPGHLDSTIDLDVKDKVSLSSSDPEKIERYIVKRQLGQGTFGVVYLAFDPELTREVAIKVRLQTDGAFLNTKLFKDEAAKAAALSHPAIVQVFDTGVFDGQPFIVQEYIDGENLRQWSLRQSRSAIEIASMLLHILDGLAYLHSQEITHCDFKLENLLIRKSGIPAIADFGLAVRQSQSERYANSRFGTTTTMSPEQVRFEGDRLDGRADIWAFGVVLYQLLTGRPPFAGTKSDVRDKILSKDALPPSQLVRSIPSEMNRICLKCLAKERLERYQSADEVKSDLSSWMNSQSQPWRNGLRGDWRYVAGSLAIALLIVVASVFVASRGAATNQRNPSIGGSDASSEFAVSRSPSIDERIQGATETSIYRIAATSPDEEIRELAERFKDNPRELLRQTHQLVDSRNN